MATKECCLLLHRPHSWSAIERWGGPWFEPRTGTNCSLASTFLCKQIAFLCSCMAVLVWMLMCIQCSYVIVNCYFVPCVTFSTCLLHCGTYLSACSIEIKNLSLWQLLVCYHFVASRAFKGNWLRVYIHLLLRIKATDDVTNIDCSYSAICLPATGHASLMLFFRNSAFYLRTDGVVCFPSGLLVFLPGDLL